MSSPESSPPFTDNRTREQLVALYTIGRSVNSTLDTVAVLESLLDTTLALFQAEAGSIMLVVEGFLEIAAARGLDEGIIESTRLRIGESIAGWVAQSGKPLLLDGRADAERFRGLVAREEEITSSLATPLKHRGELIGVLMIRRGGEHAFPPEQRDFLASVADQAALALVNARLYEKQRSQLHQLKLEKQKLEAILSSMADGVLVLDEQGQVSKSNRAARDYLGAGSSLAELLPHLSLDRLRRESGLREELQLQRRCFHLNASPLLAGGSRPEGYVLLLRDLTEHREMERMKSEFLSMVSHELKTPITTIRAFQELLLYRNFPEARQQHYLQICLDESERLCRLVEEILSLSRLEAGQFAFNKSPVQLEALVLETLVPFRERTPTHRFEFEAEHLPALELDPTLMAQAVSNLISNAIKYSPEGGTIAIHLWKDGRQVRLTVRDEGVGIPLEQQGLIFEKFYRVDNSLTRVAGGTGLGLANVKIVVEGHQGSVWVESVEGRGSAFTVALPLVLEKRERSG